MDYQDSKWTNDSWTIEWVDADTVLITGPYAQYCRIHGGDLENMLAALCAAHDVGRHET